MDGEALWVTQGAKRRNAQRWRCCRQSSPIGYELANGKGDRRDGVIDSCARSSSYLFHRSRTLSRHRMPFSCISARRLASAAPW